MEMVLETTSHRWFRLFRQLRAFSLLFIVSAAMWFSKDSVLIQLSMISRSTIKESTRPDGYIALLYSGTVRSFSRCFRSQLVNVIAPSPFKVHLFFQAFANDISLQLNSTKNRSSYNNLQSLNSTLNYFEHFQDLDGRWIRTEDIIRGFQVNEISEDDITRTYSEQIDEIARHETYPKTSPLLLYILLHASTLVDQLRLRYEERVRVRYKWVNQQRLSSSPTS